MDLINIEISRIYEFTNLYLWMDFHRVYCRPAEIINIGVKSCRCEKVTRHGGARLGRPMYSSGQVWADDDDAPRHTATFACII